MTCCIVLTDINLVRLRGSSDRLTLRRMLADKNYQAKVVTTALRDTSSASIEYADQNNNKNHQSLVVCWLLTSTGI